MIRSMTGFGRSHAETADYRITVEFKSVNHRYFEFTSRVPRQYAFLEEKLKSFTGASVGRGKVECSLQIDSINDTSAEVQVNLPLAAAYASALRQMSKELELKDDFGASLIARFPDVLVITKGEADEQQLWDCVRPVAEAALNDFIAMRTAEGARIREDLLTKCDAILELVSFVEARSPQTVEEYRARLYEKMQEVLQTANVDEQRILTEAAIYADKVAVDEETVRLRSHITQLKQFLNSDTAIGRKMDFLVQEMNREANTIASKCSNVDIASKVVEIKSEIEKIREQIQNIE